MRSLQEIWLWHGWTGLLLTPLWPVPSSTISRADELNVMSCGQTQWLHGSCSIMPAFDALSCWSSPGSRESKPACTSTKRRGGNSRIALSNLG